MYFAQTGTNKRARDLFTLREYFPHVSHFLWVEMVMAIE